MKPGDYVLATKYKDGHSADPWVVGYFVRKEDDRFIVADENGKVLRASGFRKCIPISKDEGRFLLEEVEKLREDYIYLSIYGFLRSYRKRQKKEISKWEGHTINWNKPISISICGEEHNAEKIIDIDHGFGTIVIVKLLYPNGDVNDIMYFSQDGAYLGTFCTYHYDIDFRQLAPSEDVVIKNI